MRGRGRSMASWKRMRPGSLAKIRMRSAISTASSMLCDTTSMALVGMPPCVHNSRMSSRRRSPVSTSSAEKASSISSTSGCVTSARAMPTRWRIPPESSRGSAPSKPARPIRLIAFSARSARSARAMPRASRPSSTFCCTVSQGNSANDWNTMLIARAGPYRGWPRYCTVPASTPISPAMMRSSVLLPEPDWPSKATISPSRSVNSTPSSTGRSRPSAERKDLRTSWISMMGEPCLSMSARISGYLSVRVRGAFRSASALRRSGTGAATRSGSCPSRRCTSRRCPARCDGSRRWPSCAQCSCPGRAPPASCCPR